MLLQVVLLLTTAADWKGYIDYMRQSLDRIVSMSTFSIKIESLTSLEGRKSVLLMCRPAVQK